MTSSLVGSEMCIRDRHATPHHTAPHRTTLPPIGPPATPTESEDQRTPVSYTHLTLPTICSV
eukprot:2852893-Prorocentrum_lima.AAC.1